MLVLYPNQGQSIIANGPAEFVLIEQTKRGAKVGVIADKHVDIHLKGAKSKQISTDDPDLDVDTIS